MAKRTSEGMVRRAAGVVPKAAPRVKPGVKPKVAKSAKPASPKAAAERYGYHLRDAIDAAAAAPPVLDGAAPDVRAAGDALSLLAKSSANARMGKMGGVFSRKRGL